MPSVKITEENLAIETLRRSWSTRIYSPEDGIGPMGSLHEAGDALVAVAHLEDHGSTILGSGVMIGPGLAIVATHVLQEFSAREADPVLLTFLPDGTRAWLPRESAAAGGPSAFGPDRRIFSDVSLLSCTLNSKAYDQQPLTLAPLQIALPAIGDRLWAFGYRHDSLKGKTALVTPLVASGLVTAVFPHGRGERMPSGCVEVAMEAIGGMSGGPVVNDSGDLVGIVSSSLEGGPSYVTLIWEALRLRVTSRLPALATLGDIDLFEARDLGLVKFKGEVRRSKRGDITVTLSTAEAELMVKSAEAGKVVFPQPGTRRLVDSQLEDFAETWLPEIEEVAARTALEHLERYDLNALRSALVASGVSESCLVPIYAFTVYDFQGIEDPDIQPAIEDESTISVRFAFDMLSIVWTVQVPIADYKALVAEYDANFQNVQVNGSIVEMEFEHRYHFEVALVLDKASEQITEASILFVGAVNRRPAIRQARHALARGQS